MTLEIEYIDGEIHGVDPKRYRFYPKSKEMIFNMPKPYRALLYCERVDRKLTNHGVVYSGIITHEENDKIKGELKFYLYL